MLSVIIPTYNRETTISKALESVLNQTYQNFEIIIVDDCSTDRTVDIINGFSSSKIRLLSTEKNSGAARARNIGIKNAKNDIISLLDSDDYYEPSFLEESFNKLHHSSEQIGFMWTGLRVINQDGIKTECWKPTFVESNYLTFLHALHIGTNSGISIKKIVFDKCGYFNESLPAAEDTDFFLRITQQFGFTYIDKPLINIDKRGEDRLSKNYTKIAQAYNLFLPQHFNTIEQYKKLQFKFYYKLMWLNYHLNDKNLARCYFKKMRTTKTLHLKAIIIILIFELLPKKWAQILHKKLS